MAVAGSAVGLGNFLRFPGQAAQHGGGAFMLPYFTALLFLGIPLCWAEWTMGRYGGTQGYNSAPGIFASIGRRPAAKYWGVLALVVPLVVYMYYVVIEAWCLAYAWKYATGSLMLGSDPAAYKGFFNTFTGGTADGSLLAGDGPWLIGLVIFVSGLNLWLIYRGIGRGIETFCNIALPTMAVLAVLVLVRVMTLGAPDPAEPERNVAAGLGYMWNPNPAALANPKTWLAAAGQVFFTLGVGFAVVPGDCDRSVSLQRRRHSRAAQTTVRKPRRARFGPVHRRRARPVSGFDGHRRPPLGQGKASPGMRFKSSLFVLRASSFIRHLSSDIRHS